MIRRSLAVVTLCVALHACSRADDPATIDAMRALAGDRRADPGMAGPARADEWRQFRRFYTARGFHPAWVVAGRPTPQLDALIASLRDAPGHGLDPREYGLDALERERETARAHWFGARVAPERIPRLDAAATSAFLRVASDLRDGRVDPAQVDRAWRRDERDREPLDAVLARALERGVQPVLASLAPPHPQYAALRATLAETNAAEPPAQAVRAADGTDAAGWRRERLLLNMERWRWAPRDLGERYVLVNVPAYQLQVIDRGRVALAMRVVVGAPDTPTPLFSDAMTYVVFSPFWNIPETIMREETLPRVASDPDYLARAGIEVVRVVGTRVEPVDPAEVDWSADFATQGYRLRQVPGPENALGNVKFIFPNHFAVYLHDTPADGLFARRARALSHGCVRVEQPVALAREVLGDQPAWTREHIVAAMHAQEESIVKLRAPLPVHLGYWTAWAGPDGRVAFLDDPYGLDRRQARVGTRRR